MIPVIFKALLMKKITILHFFAHSAACWMEHGVWAILDNNRARLWPITLYAVSIKEYRGCCTFYISSCSASFFFLNAINIPKNINDNCKNNNDIGIAFIVTTLNANINTPNKNNRFLLNSIIFPAPSLIVLVDSHIHC